MSNNIHTVTFKAKALPLPLTEDELIAFLHRIEKTATHWWWRGPSTVTHRCRYGVFYVHRIRRLVKAHRLSLALSRGERRELDVDHVCRQTLCVNPAHLEWVTHAENHRRRRTPVCKYGHPRINGHCATCNRLNVAKWIAAHRDRARAISRASYQRIGRATRRRRRETLRAVR